MYQNHIKLNESEILVIIITFFVLDPIIIAYIIDLIIFHIRLKYLGQTTYEYIM